LVSTKTTTLLCASHERGEEHQSSGARFWRFVLVASSLINAAPLWAAKYLPFTDLPEHVAAASTLRHWFDPAWRDPQTFALAFGKSQYLAYHVVVALLDVDGKHADLANRLVMTAVAVALPFAMRSLLRAYGTDERLALFACPLFWCRPLVIGFLPYMAALPVLLYALALAVHQVRAPSRRRGVGLAALAVLVFYLHVSAYAVLALVAVVLALLPPFDAVAGPLRRRLASLAWLAPSLGALGAWVVLSDQQGGPALLTSETAVRYLPQASLGLFFAAWTHDLWVSHLDEWLAVAFWLLFLWLGAQRGVAEPGGARAVAARFAPFACVLLLYLVVPFKVGAGAMLNVRLGVLLALFILLVPRPDPGPPSRWPFLLAVVMLVVGAGNAASQIRGSQRELGDLDAVLAQIPPGARVLSIHFERDSAYTHSAPWVHVLAHHRTRRGGVASMSFSEMSHWPIQYRPETRPPRKSVMFWDFEPCVFRNSEDGDYYDFVVSRGVRDPFANDPPGPRWRELSRVNLFRIFAKVPEPGSAPREVSPQRVDLGPCWPENRAAP
jgi:hypothetical protein